MRRVILVTLAAGVVATAPVPSRAVTEVEGTGYGGQTAGGWVCGPVGRARYGGAAAQVRVSSRRPTREQGRGWTGSAAASVERESVTIIRCDDDPCDPDDAVAPPDANLYAGRLKGGWHSRLVGLEIGASIYQAWDDNEDRRPTVHGFPQLELDIGPERVHGRLGLGDPFLTTVRRPGVYSALAVDVGGDNEIDVGLSVLRAGPGAPADDMKLRLDTVGRVALGDIFHLRLGGAMWSPFETSRVEGELSLGLGAAIE